MTAPSTTTAPLVVTRGLRKLYPVRRGLLGPLTGKPRQYVHAVDGVDLDLQPGEILAVVGESGCGKTTTGRLLALLETPTSGEIVFEGTSLASLSGDQVKAFRRRVQTIFQDPYQTLDPRYTVADSVGEPLMIHGIGSRADRAAAVTEILELVGLRPPHDYLHRYPHELSGGQRQRVAIARAMILHPTFVIADEPISMLDISMRAGVMNLMLRLRDQLSVGYVFITHDLSAGRYMADRVAVMYLGRVVEIGPTEEVVKEPRHPYTGVLLEAVPVPDPTFGRARVSISGEPPNPINIPVGCRFAPRCPLVQEVCIAEDPPLREVAPGRFAACHFA